MERKPHFFKVLLGDFSQRLKMPVDFVKHISTEALKRVTLQGPSGRCWDAELGKSSKGTFLCCGWTEFAQDHALREYEFLVFRYDGDFRFSVKVFGVNACEREDLFTINPRKRRKLCEEKDEPGRQVESSLDVSRLLRSRVTKNELQEDHISLPGRDADKGKCLLHSETTKDVKIKSEWDDYLIKSIASPSIVNRKRCLQRRQHVIEEEKMQAPEAVNSFMSNFPFVVVKIRQYHVARPNTLRLPRSFSHMHLPRKKTIIILRDPDMKSWEVMHIPRERDRDLLSAGWCAFCRGNKLKEGDFCVFELVKPLQLNVHIFRMIKISKSR